MKDGFDIAIKVTWALIGLCLVAFIIMFNKFLINNEWIDDWFLVFSIPLFIFCVIFIAILYNLRSVYKQEQDEIKHGIHLMHWIYEENEWSRFNKSEWIRTRKRAIFIPLGCIGVFLFIGVLDTEFRQEVLPIAAPWIVGFFISLSLLLLFYTHSLYKRTLNCPREVYIGLHGISYGGFYTTWSGVGTKLGKVKLIPGDTSVLEFEIKVWGRYGYNSRPLRILVPKELEKEAEEVITKLSS